jgi:hypothetical protein
MLWDGIEFKREIINMGDKKARFALAIVGALNAALLVMLTRAPVLQLMTDGVRAVLAVLLVIYGTVTFGFVIHTIEAIRPRGPEARKFDQAEWDARQFGHESRPMGLFIRGPLDRLPFTAEREIWNNARLSDVNAELILFNRSSSFMLTRQAEAVGKVYQRLKVLVLLAAAVTAVIVAASIARVARV